MKHWSQKRIPGHTTIARVLWLLNFYARINWVRLSQDVRPMRRPRRARK